MKPKDRPFPQDCFKCGQNKVHQVLIPYNAKCRWDGILHEFFIAELPVIQCEQCLEIWFTNITDEVITESLARYLEQLNNG